MDLKRLAAAMGLRDSRRFEEAAKEFGLMAMETADPEWKSNLLMTEHGCYCSLGRLDEAERVLEAMRGIKTDHVAIEMSREFSEACFLVQKGEAKRGLDAFESILARFGEPLGTIEFRYLYEDIQQRRGAVLANLGQYDRALVILREAESFRFDRIEDQQSVHLFIGICNRGLGRSDLAKEQFLRAIDFHLGNAVEAHARYDLAVLYINAREFAQAKDQLEMILRTFDNNIKGVSQKSLYETLSKTCHYLGHEEESKLYSELSQGGDGVPIF